MTKLHIEMFRQWSVEICIQRKSHRTIEFNRDHVKFRNPEKSGRDDIITFRKTGFEAKGSLNKIVKMSAIRSDGKHELGGPPERNHQDTFSVIQN